MKTNLKKLLALVLALAMVAVKSEFVCKLL